MELPAAGDGSSPTHPLWTLRHPIEREGEVQVEGGRAEGREQQVTPARSKNKTWRTREPSEVQRDIEKSDGVPAGIPLGPFLWREGDTAELRNRDSNPRLTKMQWDSLEICERGLKSWCLQPGPNTGFAIRRGRVDMATMNDIRAARFNFFCSACYRMSQENGEGGRANERECVRIQVEWTTEGWSTAHYRGGHNHTLFQTTVDNGQSAYNRIVPTEYDTEAQLLVQCGISITSLYEYLVKRMQEENRTVLFTRTDAYERFGRRDADLERCF